MAKKGLPKKYAKMGFKKGWAAYKKAKGKTSSSTTSRSRKATTKLKTTRKVAKKRKAPTKRKQQFKLFGINVGKAAIPVIYGAIRSRVSNLLAPITAKVPLGTISDEATMYTAQTLAKKYLVKGKGPVRDVLTAGQNIELAMVGSEIANGNVNLGMLSNLFNKNGSNSTVSSGNIF